MSMVFCRGCGKEIHETAPVCPHCGATQQLLAPASAAAPAGLKSQTVASLLAAFLGGLGGHRFYLGPIWLGVVYLLFCWTGIPGLIASVETFLIVFAGQDKWARKYNNGVVTPPCHIAVKILVCIFPVIAILGILAAVAIPAYQDFTTRAKVAETMAALVPVQSRLASSLAGPLPTGLPEGELAAIRGELLGHKYIAEADAFAYGNYADVGVRLKDAGKAGSFFMRTRDGGASWECVTTDSDVRFLPKTCQQVGSIERPVIPPPLRMIGQWTETTYKAVVDGCRSGALEKGLANPVQYCDCLAGKAADAISEEQMAKDELPPEMRQLLDGFAAECKA